MLGLAHSDGHLSGFHLYPSAHRYWSRDSIQPVNSGTTGETEMGRCHSLSSLINTSPDVWEMNLSYLWWKQLQPLWALLTTLREIMAGDLKATSVAGKGLSHFHLSFVHCIERSKAMEFHTFLAHLLTWLKRPSKDMTLSLSELLLIHYSLGSLPIIQEKQCGGEDKVESSDVRLSSFNTSDLCDFGEAAYHPEPQCMYLHNGIIMASTVQGNCWKTSH